jgi:signal transduction histidine kinase
LLTFIKEVLLDSSPTLPLSFFRHQNVSATMLYLETLPLSQGAEELLSSLTSETADLKNQLHGQDKLVKALEQRVARSLDSIQTHLSKLDQSFHNDPDWQKSLSSMAGELHQLGDLLSDATLLQKLEAGKVLVHLEAVDLRLLLDCVTRHLSNSRQGTAPRLIYKIPTLLPWVLIDHEQTEAVLMDLLERALKYSDSGSTIVLEVNCSKSWVTIGLSVQRFAPVSQRDFAPEIALCCKRVEIQNGKIICQMRSDGSTSVTIDLQVSTAQPSA